MQIKAVWGRNISSHHTSPIHVPFTSLQSKADHKELTHPYFHKTVSLSLTLYKYGHLYTGKLKVVCRSKRLKSHLLGILAFNKVGSVSSFDWM